MPQGCQCSRGTWAVPWIKWFFSFCSSLQCQALGPGDHCRSLTAELFCSCWLLFLSEDFLFPAAATPVCSQRECRYLCAVWVLATAWPPHWCKNYLAHSFVPLTPESCICVPSALDLIQDFPQDSSCTLRFMPWFTSLWEQGLFYSHGFQKLKKYMYLFIPVPSKLCAPAF